MKTKVIAGRASGERQPVARGRPPVHRAGEVETRLLDAARELFLARGFEGTSCDHVAALARAGKASIYARYADKGELFAAVVSREVQRSLTTTYDVRLDLPLRDRLISVGTRMIQNSLQPEAVALMRLIIAEVGRFPELASQADAIPRYGWVRRVAEVIARKSFPDESVERAQVPAVAFIDLVFVPQQLRALLGNDLVALRAEAESQITGKINTLEATGLFDGWN